MAQEKDDYLGKGFPISVNAFPILLTSCWDTQKSTKIHLPKLDQDTLSASVVKSFPKRYQNSDDQQDEQNIF